MFSKLLKKKAPTASTPEPAKLEYRPALVTRQVFLARHHPGSHIRADLQALYDRSVAQGVRNLLVQTDHFAIHVAEGSQLSVQGTISSVLPQSTAHRGGFLLSSHADQIQALIRPLVWVPNIAEIDDEMRGELDLLMDRLSHQRNNPVITAEEIGFLKSLELFSFQRPVAAQ